jgi:hypothetical protein
MFNKDAFVGKGKYNVIKIHVVTKFTGKKGYENLEQVYLEIIKVDFLL